MTTVTVTFSRHPDPSLRLLWWASEYSRGQGDRPLLRRLGAGALADAGEGTPLDLATALRAVADDLERGPEGR